MNDSYIERYVRARKRNEIIPKCLFGQPSQSETNEFLLQHDLEQRQNNKEIMEKYEILNISESENEDLMRSLTTTTELNSDDESFINQPSTSNVATKFQPKVITGACSPPSKNLFCPIDKIESSKPTSLIDCIEQGDDGTEYWQMSKRLRSSQNSSEKYEVEIKDEGTSDKNEEIVNK